MHSAPTPRQLQVLALVQRHTERQGLPPTLRWLTETLRLRSTNSVTGLLYALERKGCLKRLPYQARGLVLTPHGRQLLEAKA